MSDFRRWLMADDDTEEAARRAGNTVDDAADAAQMPDMPDDTSEDTGDLDAPHGDATGEHTANPLRNKPTVDAAAVRQSNRATVGGDDNDERGGGLLRELSGGITTEERATLNDPRASAANQDSRHAFDRMSNVFLTGAGLPSQGLRPNPYKSERDEMRDWVLKRGGLARGEQQNELNSQRTAAYLEATRSQGELRKAAEANKLEADGRKAEADKLRAELAKADSERKSKALEEQTRHNKATEEQAAKALAAKKKSGGGGAALAPKGFPAGWELEGKTQPTPKQGEAFEGLVYSSEKMRGLTGQMREMLKSAGAMRVVPGEMKSRMSQLAKEIQIEGKNIAELGALSGPDFALMEAIAADPTKVDSFAKDMPALLNGLDKWGDNSVSAKAKSLGARRIGGGSSAAPSAPAGDTIKVVEKATGRTGTMPRAKFDPKKFDEVK